MNAIDIFEVMLPKKLEANPMLLSSLGLKNESVRLLLEGAGGGDWAVVFGADGSCSVKKNHSSAACTINMSGENFSKLLAGQLNVPMALMTRKIKVSGDKALALKVGDAIKLALK